MLALAKKIFGSSNERKVKGMRGRLSAIEAFEPKLKALSDDQLKGKTAEFKEKLAAGATLDSILEEAFAVVRETARRTLGQRHYDVQLVGGMVLHHGGIAEMRTGEGKTLVATAPVYLNALAGKGVHVITVNDYLASRDADWMSQVYGFLGMDVGVIVHGLSQGERSRAYRADITYGTNNEFGFDYLRDNLVFDVQEMVQRGHSFAIVDEVDSILIDEARTPSDHLRPDGGPFGLLPHHRRPGAGDDPGQDHLRARREAEAGHPHRARQRNGRGAGGRRRSP